MPGTSVGSPGRKWVGETLAAFSCDPLISQGSLPIPVAPLTVDGLLQV